MILNYVSTKLIDALDPALDPVRRFVRNVLVKFQNWKIKKNFRFRFMRAKIVPEREPGQQVLIIPNEYL